LQVRIHERYGPDGVVLWGLVANESADKVADYGAALGLTFPILIDKTGEVGRLYDQAFAFPTGAFPKDYVIDNDGRVIYAHNEPDVEAIEAAMVTALAAD
jgi:peroxiredoxin